MNVYPLYLLILLLPNIILSQKASLIEEIRAHNDGIALWWSGHNGWLIKSGDLLISTDILLDYDKRKLPPSITAEELATELDISFITHGHKDHFKPKYFFYLTGKIQLYFRHA